MELVVNGQRRAISTDPDRSLLEVLRDELELTGSKYGCGEAQCGACAVLIDGVPKRSCVTLATAAAGKEITTIEGIADGERLHPLQRAFIDADAMQCGYCTPGMIVEGVALLRKNRTPTRAQIADALEHHVCRCGTYSRIVAAVEVASRLMARDEKESSRA